MRLTIRVAAVAAAFALAFGGVAGSAFAQNAATAQPAENGCILPNDCP